ncbi:MAG: MFS transporter [Armatimonadota bacterium]
MNHLSTNSFNGNSSLSVWRVRDYRLYWIGMLTSFMGSWMQNVAMGWYVYLLTNDQFLLGLVPFLGQLPITLFGLFGGVLVDRFERRRLVMLTSFISFVLAAILAVLAQLHMLAFWHVVLIAVASGFVMTVDGPSRQAIVMDMLGPELMPVGIAMNSVAFNISRILGPVAGALVMDWKGAGWCFGFNAISYLAVVVMMLYVTVRPSDRSMMQNSAWSDVLAGIRMVKKNPLMKAILSLDAVICLFGLSYVALLPVYAKDIFQTGQHGLGTMYSATGVGALLGAILLGQFVGKVPRGQALLITSSILCMGLVVFNGIAVWHSHWAFYIAMIGLALVGCGMVSTLASINSLMQLQAPPSMTGRAASLHFYAMAGIGPFGSLLVGWLARQYSAISAVWVCVIFCIMAVVILGMRRDIRQLDVY